MSKKYRTNKIMFQKSFLQVDFITIHIKWIKRVRYFVQNMETKYCLLKYTIYTLT